MGLLAIASDVIPIKHGHWQSESPVEEEEKEPTCDQNMSAELFLGFLATAFDVMPVKHGRWQSESPVEEVPTYGLYMYVCPTSF